MFKNRGSFADLLVAGKVVIFLLIAINTKSLKAQDTVFNYNPYWTHYYLIEEPTEALSLDTTISYFNRFNPAESAFGYLHTGHIGAAAAPMFFVPPASVAFDLGLHTFDLYWLASDRVRFYDTKHPYTKVSYQQGSKAEVLGSFAHTQNILPQWSLGVNLNRYRVDGYYQRQVSKITNFDAFTRYASRSGFYHMNFAYLLNVLKVEENGGVENLDVFTDTTLFDKSLQPVLLDSAMNNWKNDAIFFQNAFDLGKWQEVKKNDSVTYKKVDPAFRLHHYFKWEKKSYRFRDDATDDDYYNAIYLDSLKTRDTIQYNSITNVFRLKMLARQKGWLKNVSSDFYFHHDFYDIRSNLGKQNIQNGIAGIDLLKSLPQDSIRDLKFDFHLSGSMNLIDRNRGDYLVHLDVLLITGSSHEFSVALQQSSNHPSFIQEQFLSNHFFWKNDFSNDQTTDAKIEWKQPRWRFKLSGEIFSVNKYLYWNRDALPAQYDGTLQGFMLFLQKDFAFKGFHLDNELQYQQYSNDTVTSFPRFISRHSLYFQNRLFKGALNSKIGIDVRYNSDYEAPAYMPATGQFYEQRYSTLHFYPVADVFLTIQIKGVRAFVMFQNVNKDLFEPGYFSVYRAPMPDRSFRLGLEWRFWN